MLSRYQREMRLNSLVESIAIPSTEDAKQTREYNIEAVVFMVLEAGRADIDSDKDGQPDQDLTPYRGRCTLLYHNVR